MPVLAELKGQGDIRIIGKTDLTNGQLKQTIEQRHVVVSKFLDKDDKWHCFFQTYRGLGEQENYSNGQPHLHDISSAWGLPREFVLKQLKSGGTTL